MGEILSHLMVAVDELYTVINKVELFNVLKQNLLLQLYSANCDYLQWKINIYCQLTK